MLFKGVYIPYRNISAVDNVLSICQYIIMDEKEILRQIGNNIRAERNRARLTQEKLAEMISINEKNLGKIERGQSNVKITNIIAIMKALNIPFDQLYKF